MWTNETIAALQDSFERSEMLDPGEPPTKSSIKEANQRKTSTPTTPKMYGK